MDVSELDPIRGERGRHCFIVHLLITCLLITDYQLLLIIDSSLILVIIDRPL